MLLAGEQDSAAGVASHCLAAVMRHSGLTALSD